MQRVLGLLALGLVGLLRASPAAAQAAPAVPRTPAATATPRATATAGVLSVTAGVMNPSPAGAPLWLWVESSGSGAGMVLVEDLDLRSMAMGTTGNPGTVLWRAEASTLRPEGQVIVVPRPSAGAVRVVIQSVNGERAESGALPVFDSRSRAWSLPVLVVGEDQSAVLAERMRSRAPDRLVHAVPAAALPVAVAPYIGVSAVILGPDAQLPDAQAKALKLLNCARGGVVALGPITMPVHGACPDPLYVVGAQGVPSAGELLASLRDLQLSLGILEERGSNGLTPGADDADAVGAMLIRRPSAKKAVGVMALVFLAMAAAFWLTRRLKPGSAVLVLLSVPLVGALAVASLRLFAGSPPDALRMVTVDVKQGSPVALVRVVEAAWQPHGMDALDTAWVVRPEQAARKAAGQALPLVVESWDVVDVPTDITVAPNPAEPDTMVIKIAGVAAPLPAFNCGSDPDGVTIPGDAVQQAQGKLLLERCKRQRGTVGLLDPDAIPGLAKVFGQLPLSAARSAWLYVLEPKGGRP